MIEARLLFGDETVDIQPPDRAQVVGGGDGAERGARLEPVGDQEAAVRDALARPLGLPRIGEMAKPGDSVLIAFDDPTVPSFGPVRRLAIAAILAELGERGAVVAANLKRPVFKVEPVLAHPATIGRVWAGGVAECRAAAVETQSSLHKPRRSEAEPADVVIYGVPAWSPYPTRSRTTPPLTLGPSRP